MELHEFNALSDNEAEQKLRPCLDVERWVHDIAAGRPYSNVQQVLDRAEHAGSGMTAEEVNQAMEHHPRIGERAAGPSQEAHLSREEQEGLNITESIQTRLEEGNLQYEQRFDRVFLIRAAGRTPEEILAELNRRMKNSNERETSEVADQLTQIATLRLEGLFS